MHRVTVIGATGLIGSEVVRLGMTKNNIELTVVARRVNDSVTDVTWVATDFDSLLDQANAFNCETLVITLGTTIKKAGSKDAFKKIDYEYALTAASLAKQQQAKRLIVVTAVGSNKNSSIFYNRVKGELEQALTDLGFDELQIIQPSLLLGERQEARAGEDLGQLLAPILSKVLIGPLSKYKPIKGSQVAGYIVSQLEAPILCRRLIVHYDQLLSR